MADVLLDDEQRGADVAEAVEGLVDLDDDECVARRRTGCLPPGDGCGDCGEQLEGAVEPGADAAAAAGAAGRTR